MIVSMDKQTPFKMELVLMGQLRGASTCSMLLVLHIRGAAKTIHVNTHNVIAQML